MVTIIILLILAGVTLNIALSDNGLFERAKGGTEKYKKAQTNEEELITDLEKEIENYGGGGNPSTVTPTPPDETPTPMPMADAKEKEKFETTTKVEDEYGNIVVIPGEFHIPEDSGDTVQDGIVIEDSKGNQFVWIPVSNVDGDNKMTGSEKEEDLIKLDGDNKVEITLGRYTFGNSIANGKTELVQRGSEYNIGEKDIGTCQENTKEERTNGGAGAKALDKFIESVKDNHGYYIARYEAGKGTDGNTPISKAGPVWNNVTQEAASTAARGMYKENVNAEANYVESDLVNSYAWDTAIVYIQVMSNENNNYAHQTDGNGNLQNTGTRNDEKCHIHDMAGNLTEWTTEYSTFIRYGVGEQPCVGRGGDYLYSAYSTALHTIYTTTESNDYVGFRPLLYLR